MKKLDVFSRTLSQASGCPEERFREMVLALLGDRIADSTFLEEVSDEEAEQLLQGFREERPGISNWLEEGRRRAVWRLHGCP